MFIPTIYIENSNDNRSVEVSDKKLHHLNKVLRLRDGDKVNISDGKGLIYYGNLINNFVEIKNSLIGSHSKANHLSYLGDANLGTNVNVGAGTITCNYDGVKKNKTTISDNVFIGSNSSLVAPIKINKNAVVGAGSVITKDVKENSLSIERSEQEEIENYKRKK